jgi:uncharacterized membrane protein
MNGAHLHLLVNDVPILASLFAALFFAIALWMDPRDTWVRAGLILLGIASIGGLIAFLSGDPALAVIEGQQHSSGRALSEHHVRATVAICVLGAAALAGVIAFVTSRTPGASHSPGLITILFVATLASALAMGWTGLAGGRINHPELQQPGDREGGPAHHH